MSLRRVRAKSGHIKTKRLDKAGRVVEAKDAMTSGLGGSYTAKEMERELMDVCDETGASYDQIVVETYAHGEAPVETDPMRGERMRARASSGWSMPAEGYDRAFGTSGETKHAARATGDPA